jgi:hypothetical protein
MGTRLYPITTNSNTLEALAEVPKGTMERLTKTQANHKELLNAARSRKEDTLDLEHELWREINDNPDMGPMDNFHTFGWGKLRGDVYDLLENNTDKWEGELYNGVCEDPELCAQMLLAQGVVTTVSPSDVGGLTWG